MPSPVLLNSTAAPLESTHIFELAAAVTPVFPALDNTFGAAYLGTCFGLILYGLTAHQAYRYCRLYPKDSTFLKSFVLVAVLVETLHSICSIHLVYHYLVTNFANPFALTNEVWSLRTLTWVSGLTIILAQSLTWMLWKKRTGFKNTDTLIQVIVLYTINTGLLTGIFGLLSFVFNIIYIGISLFGTKLYVNSVLAVLNSRKSLNERSGGGLELNTFDENGFPSTRSGSRSKNAHLTNSVKVAQSGKPTHIDIHVKTGGDALDNAESGSSYEMRKAYS
ncbi:hypothetical protein BC628DRAFT_1012352 [Trametes gibbosa]|nr:hypothetical protein BC628DRAFT_1012352 [Trametes gibbosa]